MYNPAKPYQKQYSDDEEKRKTERKYFKYNNKSIQNDGNIKEISTKDFLAFSKDLTGALICSQMLGSEIPIVEKEPQNT